MEGVVNTGREGAPRGTVRGGEFGPDIVAQIQSPDVAQGTTTLAAVDDHAVVEGIVGRGM